MPDRIRLGILGCGAITQNVHLPTALCHPCVQVTALVDADLNRARLLQRFIGPSCGVAERFSDVLGNVDAAIIAMPNHLHASATIEALKAGVHVLCEKPLALTASDARACCEAASAKDLVLAVGLNRRFEDRQVLLRRLLEEDLLGSLAGYDWESGSPWEWETASGFYFSRAQAGGGVFMDAGVHLLDSLLDWFGPVNQVEYQHDDWGSGIEANALLNLHHSGGFGEVTGRVRLSRTYNLRNSLVVSGSAARAVLPDADRSIINVHRLLGGQEASMTLRLTGSDSPEGSFLRQMSDFIESIQSHRQAMVDGWQAVRLIDLVERCYAQARRLPEPWAEVDKVCHEAGR
ncbi:MAG: Gfo/Idh/MocA family oxidoreductase [Candidatus Acidiferrales bacterium]